MSQLRAPGVYFEPSEQRVAPLELGKTGVPVFVGVARRGPLDRPVRVTSEVRFLELFGEAVSGSYLLSALRGFFDNGGDAAFVLRVARVVGEATEDIARCSSAKVFDRAGVECLEVRAQDEGAWGNHLRLSLATRAMDGRTFLTRDARVGDDALQVKSSHGISVGTTIRITDEVNEQWVVVTRVDAKVLSLDAPLLHDLRSAAPTYVTPQSLELRIRDQDRDERYDHVSLHGASPRFVERIVNEASRLIRCTVLRSSTPTALAAPMDQLDGPLVGGSDGVADLGPDDFIGHDRGPTDRRGLWGLVEHPELDLLVLPDLMSAFKSSKRFRSLRDVEVVQDAAIALCERSRHWFALLDVPPGGDFEEALRWRQQFDSAHAAFYFPWVITLEGGRPSTVPSCGHVAGVISRVDRETGIHKAPANEVLMGVVDLAVLVQDSHLAMLNAAGINCIRPFAARGIRIWGARTASSDPENRHLNVRRTIGSIGAAIERGTQWAVFEPNGPDLWKRVSRSIVGFLIRLREKGMLTGSTPEEAFYVKCDEETNAPEDVDRGMMISEIGLAITRPVEFIVFRVAQRLEDQAQQTEE
ncbi:MAG: phage tail sheath family protein [Myxococcales bacterium]|nr:phage tail sheath family protein [Myxococcales bacterium]